MSDEAQIAAGLEQVFQHRRSFLVIGLTGMTGSGCSTIADALTLPTKNDLSLTAIQAPPMRHEDRKQRIVQNWLGYHWRPFQKIQVSQLIAAFSLREPYVELTRIMTGVAPRADLSPLRDKLSNFEARSRELDAVLQNPRGATSDMIAQAHEFYFEHVPAIANAMKTQLTETVGWSNYTKIFQALGDNIRRSGRAVAADIHPPHLMTLPRMIESLIELGRTFNLHRGRLHDYFVIDALRNPFEIRYLRERIAPFYLFAVRAEPSDRHDRLARHMTGREIEQLDRKENPDKDRLRSYSGLISQDIQACLELADVYISNPGRTAQKDFTALHTQLARYVALMQHPGLVTPTHVERCMQVAFTARVNSGCISRQVGAVVTNAEFSVKAIGWNDVPRGQIPCILRNIEDALSRGAWDPIAYSDFEKRNEPFRRQLSKSALASIKVQHIEGHNLSFCFKSTYNAIRNTDNQVHTRSLHAEENAFLQIARYGGDALINGVLFSTASPCVLCAKKAYQLGIKTIFYIDPYPDIAQDHVLTSGTSIPELELFYGAIGRAYHDLYEPMMPYKDELQSMVAPKTDVKNPSLI